MARATYDLIIEDAYGAISSRLVSATAAQLTLNLNAPGTLDVNFDAGSADFGALMTVLSTKMPVLRMTRDGSTVFKGPLVGMTGSLGDSGEVTASFTDWVGILDQAPVVNGFAGAQTANTYIDNFLDFAKSNFWPTTAVTAQLTRSGSVAGNITPDSSQWSSHLDALNLWADYNSADWYVDYANSYLQIASALGSDKSGSVLFGFGDVSGAATRANVQSVNTTIRPPINTVYVQNAKGQTVVRPSSLPTTSTIAYGILCEHLESTYSSAASVATAARRDNPVIVHQLIADPQVAPTWLTDYYLGDTISVKVATEGFTSSGAWRVNQLIIDFTDDMIEAANTITLETV
jgi:hypothetical protein